MLVATVWAVRTWSTDAWAGGVTLSVALAIVIALSVRAVRGFITGELLRLED